LKAAFLHLKINERGF